jgi:hypothetical protein
MRGRKTRTRQHVIADLGVNHLERLILLCGHTAERVRHDYGYDLAVFTYDQNGEVEGGLILVQVKSTDGLPLLKDGRTIPWKISRRDLKLWLRESYPVILVVYDARRDRAHWLHVQAEVAGGCTADVFGVGDVMTVRIPCVNRIDLRSIRKWTSLKNHIHHRMVKRGQRHD